MAPSAIISMPIIAATMDHFMRWGYIIFEMDGNLILVCRVCCQSGGGKKETFGGRQKEIDRETELDDASAYIQDATAAYFEAKKRQPLQSNDLKRLCTKIHDIRNPFRVVCI